MSKIAIFLIVIITAGAGLAGFWYWQGNSFSRDILKIDILGPDQAQAGDLLGYAVRFKNNGKVRLEQAELVFEFPQNSVPAEEPQRVIEKLDDIYPGEERTMEFKAYVFGREGDILKAQAFLTYKAKNLKAQYESQTSLSTQLKSVPLTFEFDLPLKVEQGETIDFSLNYFSNINYFLENLRVKMEYPNGFEFVSSQPKALDKTDWDLPDLSRADGGRIEIKGSLEGEEGSSKIFKAQLGLIYQDRFILLKETEQTVEIIEPSLYVSQLVNGSQNYTAETGDVLHYEIFFKNIGKKPIQKKFLFVNLESDFFDLGTLKSTDGEFGRGDNSIIWDWKVVPELRFLDAEDEGRVEFWINVQDGSLARKIKNPILRNKITIAGTEKIFDLKLNSQVVLSQKIYYYEEVFGNSGPLPPRAEEPTTYTVFWQLTNSWNDLENVRIKTKLPDYINVTGQFFPEEAKFTFDSASREVVWNAGSLEAYAGQDSQAPLTLAFQIQFTAKENQRGQSPLLINKAEISAQDSFTSEIIEESFEGVDSTLPDDETVTPEQGIVQ